MQVVLPVFWKQTEDRIQKLHVLHRAHTAEPSEIWKKMTDIDVNIKYLNIKPVFESWATRISIRRYAEWYEFIKANFHTAQDNKYLITWLILLLFPFSKKPNPFKMKIFPFWYTLSVTLICGGVRQGRRWRSAELAYCSASSYKPCSIYTSAQSFILAAKSPRLSIWSCLSSSLPSFRYSSALFKSLFLVSGSFSRRAFSIWIAPKCVKNSGIHMLNFFSSLTLIALSFFLFLT